MPPLTLLIKPASGNCNMRCQYCFYTDEVNSREEKNRGVMSFDLLEILIAKALEHAERLCSVSFQGGEPTLAGIDFFNKVVELQQKYNSKGLTVYNSIQTNGYAITEEWADFFKENNFLVGLSIDGNKSTHNAFRKAADGEGTFEKIIRTAELFDKKCVAYNILTVVTPRTVENIGKIYNFYKSKGMCYQQYIPCLDPLGAERGKQGYSLTPENYAVFLKRLFDLWYMDLINDKYIYIRYFDNIVKLLTGNQPEQCGAAGICSIQAVVEADGSVYPCDFYMLDEYYLGNIATDSFNDIDVAREKLRFVRESAEYPKECGSCEWFGLCRNGCRRDRIIVGGRLNKNYYCGAFKEFYEYAIPKLMRIL